MSTRPVVLMQFRTESLRIVASEGTKLQNPPALPTPNPSVISMHLLGGSRDSNNAIGIVFHAAVPALGRLRCTLCCGPTYNDQANNESLRNQVQMRARNIPWVQNPSLAEGTSGAREPPVALLLNKVGGRDR
jgi:hypothetical protein